MTFYVLSIALRPLSISAMLTNVTKIFYFHIFHLCLLMAWFTYFLTIITLKINVIHFLNILANGKLVFSDMCLSNWQWENTNVNTMSWDCISATGHQGRKHQGRKEGECVGDNFKLKIRGIHFKVAFLFLRLVHPRFSVSLVLLVVSTLSSQSYQCVLGDFSLNSKHSSVTWLHSCSSVTQSMLSESTNTHLY